MCLESGRNFWQALMFCAEDTVLSVLSGLRPRLSDEEVKEEMMRCFSPIPMRRQAIEMMRTMCQEDDEQMHQYIMRHEIAHAMAHRLSPDDQPSSSKIIEFTMTLQPIIQDKLLKRIDGDRSLRSLREAYYQVLNLERKNQITKRYETTVQVSQISDCTLEEDIEEIDAMELCLRDNTKRIFHGNDRGNRNFGPVGRGSFGRGSRNGSQDRRQTFEDNPRGIGRGVNNQNQNKNFCSQYQDGVKPTKGNTTFQAFNIDSKSLLEALKKLTAYNTFKYNGPETNYSRRLLQHNPNIKGRFNPGVKQETNKQQSKEDKTIAKEIAEAFSTVTGQEISEEEVSLIQGIKLPEDEMDDQTKDVEASEEAMTACKYNPDVYFVEFICCDIEHVSNIILGKKMGTTFPVSIQDKEINALLDTGDEKSCISIDMFTRLKLPINAGRTPKLRNASGKDMKTHGVTTIKFKMGNTIFVQDFIICEDLVRPIIIGRDFTVSNFIGIIWTKQGTKKVTQDDRVVIEVKEPARSKTLSMTRRIVIPPRQYAEFELECDELEGKFKIKPEPFLQQREPDLWMDSFVVYNVPEDKEKTDM